MFDALQRLFTASEDRESAARGMKPATAAAALMVEAALADGVFAREESEQIVRLLRRGFDLDEDAARATLQTAEGLVSRAVDHHQFTRVVKDLPKEERLQVMEDLWAVVLSDEERTHEEDSLLRRLGPLLAITDRERAEARQRAEARRH
ncbi:TerB family tellurite resistance protein [Marinicauda algicola]|nr:TerB family tellurite resistance protein [Marinicauda algicola]